jgi:hypothetical protein
MLAETFVCKVCKLERSLEEANLVEEDYLVCDECLHKFPVNSPIVRKDVFGGK